MTTITQPASATTLGRKLRAARVLAGLDQQQIADAIGIARSTISGWELDKFEPTASSLFAWAKVTNQTLDWFAEGVVEEMRARRDSNPQPSDLVYGSARAPSDGFWTVDRKSALLDIECQLRLDARSASIAGL